MATFAFLLATFLDPVQAALVLAVILAYRGPQPILIAAAAAAAISETIMMVAAVDYTWGEWIVPRLAASFMQAALLWWPVWFVRTRWIGMDRSRPERPQRSTIAGTLRSLMIGPAATRAAPWHTRAFVRRRLIKLRNR